MSKLGKTLVCVWLGLLQFMAFMAMNNANKLQRRVDGLEAEGRAVVTDEAVKQLGHRLTILGYGPAPPPEEIQTPDPVEELPEALRRTFR